MKKNINELIEKIKAEVKLYREREKTRPDTSYNSVQDFRNNVSSSIEPFNIDIIPEPESVELKEEYDIKDFLNYHDSHFVRNAYRGVLKRQPDSGGMQHFLESLRSGYMSKAEILGRLRYSPEGRVKKAKIKGLFLNLIVQSFFRIPLLGFFFRLAVGLVNLPVIIRNVNILENNVFAQFHDRQIYTNTLADRVKFKINELIDRYGQVEALLQKKADREELNQLKEAKADAVDLKAFDEKKADREELNKLREAKADAGDLKALEEKKADQEDLNQLRKAKADVIDLKALDENKADREDLNQLREGFEEVLEQKIDKGQVEHIQKEINRITRQIRDQKLNILEQQRCLSSFLEEARKGLPEPISINHIKEMLIEEDHLLDAMYVSFEDKFRGTREDIKKGFKVYLPYVDEVIQRAGGGKILDIGCGRGEWLELLKEEGYDAKGVDINRAMVRLSLELGLDVDESDALDCLKDIPDKSLSAVTGFHIIEHLDFKRLIALFDESLRVLKPGGLVIFETPNPENLIVGAFSFYRDPAHRNPLVPESMQFFFEQRGFNNVSIFRLHKNMQYFENKPDNEFKNKWFYNEMDYAIIGYKE
ncbi:MAG TPA: methyltransferase domain-containing protein [Desulfobacteraceae bacterium]|nr:methyltransferase domain-containing protein [Desulfobacteraceae bacterium]HPJ68633.1 methyltransferase domain-containing protein [Desulfobacteraceae bacterium]HPQ27540.1 methyltransferase domain-containing protein [Desulfobacteraceae bacterium]